MTAILTLCVLVAVSSAFVNADVHDNTVSHTDTDTSNTTSNATACPPGTTTCGPDRCCLFANATCCIDGVHCCPYGYSCDLPHQKCVRTYDQLLVNMMASRGMVPHSALQHQEAQKTCPGGSVQCPSHTSCCLNDEGLWGCCPKLAKYPNDCCYTFVGYICCDSTLFPKCTYIGCI